LSKYGLAIALWLRTQTVEHNVHLKSEKWQLIEHFDERFDQFWHALRSTPGVVRAFRDSATLRWRFRGPRKEGRLRVLAVLRSGSIHAYAILVRQEKKHLGVSQYKIMDLQSLATDPEAIQTLLGGAIDLTRRENVGYLEFVGFCEWKRKAARLLNPLVYHLPIWQSYYRATDSAMARQLVSPSRWDASPFDSD
jgi:hypothetical protein